MNEGAVTSLESDSESKKLISVAMCTYNGERFLRPQLQSILDQTYRNLELIIVDDCSSDSTMAILEEFSAGDDRIKLLRNKTNLGFIRNFARALTECRGPLIALADQDDIWLPEKLETLARELGDNLLIYSRVKLIDENDQPIAGSFPRKNRLQGGCALSLLLANPVTGHACLIRSELLKLALPFPEPLFSHDQWLSIIAAASGRLKASDAVLSLYRIHGGNTVAGAKSRTSKKKTDMYDNKNTRILHLASTLYDANLLPEQQQMLLGELIFLVRKNDRCIFNMHLYRFLKDHADIFLSSYKNEKSARTKLCRGRQLFQIYDFISKYIRRRSANPEILNG